MGLEGRREGLKIETLCGLGWDFEVHLASYIDFKRPDQMQSCVIKKNMKSLDKVFFNVCSDVSFTAEKCQMSYVWSMACSKPTSFIGQTPTLGTKDKTKISRL